MTPEDIFKEIRGMTNQPLVILTESAGMPEATRSFLEMGATAVIYKWAPCEEIAAAVRKCLSMTALESVLS